jgi:flavin reductase (DIM6/NTAB) family NADH-FMN oxidoreductase RutF
MSISDNLTQVIGILMSKRAIGKKVPPLVLPICLLGSMVKGKANFCTVAWFTMIDDEPPTLGLVLGKGRRTMDGIMENMTFSVNIPNIGQAQVTDYCGINSGHKVDKSDLFRTFNGILGNAPMIEDFPVNIECRLKEVIEFKGVDLVIGEIEDVHIDEGCMDGVKANHKLIDPLLYAMPGGPYLRSGDDVAKAFSIGKTLKKK